MGTGQKWSWPCFTLRARASQPGPVVRCAALHPTDLKNCFWNWYELSSSFSRNLTASCLSESMAYMLTLRFGCVPALTK